MMLRTDLNLDSLPAGEDCNHRVLGEGPWFPYFVYVTEILEATRRGETTPRDACNAFHADLHTFTPEDISLLAIELALFIENMALLADADKPQLGGIRTLKSGTRALDPDQTLRGLAWIAELHWGGLALFGPNFEQPTYAATIEDTEALFYAALLALRGQVLPDTSLGEYSRITLPNGWLWWPQANQFEECMPPNTVRYFYTAGADNSWNWD